MMQRYHFIAKITNYSHETIRIILNGTRTYMYYKKRKYSFKIFIMIQILVSKLVTLHFKQTLIFRYNFIMSNKKGEII